MKEEKDITHIGEYGINQIIAMLQHDRDNIEGMCFTISYKDKSKMASWTNFPDDHNLPDCIRYLQVMYDDILRSTIEDVE